MSQQNDAAKTRKSKQRGSTNNASRLASFGKKGQQKGQADWGSVDSQLLLGVVEHITRVGGAATFGLSRDGGAYMLTLLLDGDKTTLWYNGDADVEAELREVMDVIDSWQ